MNSAHLYAAHNGSRHGINSEQPPEQLSKWKDGGLEVLEKKKKNTISAEAEISVGTEDLELPRFY